MPSPRWWAERKYAISANSPCPLRNQGPLSLTCPFHGSKIRASDWANHLALSHRRGTRRRRDGCCVQSRGCEARPIRRSQVPPRERSQGPTGAEPFSARSQGCFYIESSEHLHHLRDRRVRGANLH